MARNSATPKKCGHCNSAKLTPAELLDQMIETRTTVCFQAWDGWQIYAFRGVFPGAAQGLNSFLRSFHFVQLVMGALKCQTE